MQFLTLDRDSFTYGAATPVAPLVRRVIAKNPSKFTYHGTGTYIVGDGDLVVIDPGPALDSHRDALTAATAGETVRAILVTHCHADHSPLAAWLSAETGAPTIAFGPHGDDAWDIGDDADVAYDVDEPADPTSNDLGPDLAGSREDGARERSVEGMPDKTAVEVEESVDRAFRPDIAVTTGEEVAAGPGWVMSAVHTPGHTSNHTCFALDDGSATTLFTGDHVMGWSTTVVSPPDGDMAAYLDSLRRVAGRGDALGIPTHGPPIPDLAGFVADLIEHRLDRERQVLAALRDGAGAIPDIVGRLYTATPRRLHRAAARSVLSHLVKLVDDGSVATVGPEPHPRLDSTFAPV